MPDSSVILIHLSHSHFSDGLSGFICHFGLQVVVEVKQKILAGPESTQDEAQVQVYLLALKNALLPEAIPLLTRFAESETGALSTIAITALQRYDPQLITHEVCVLNNLLLKGTWIGHWRVSLTSNICD